MYIEGVSSACIILICSVVHEAGHLFVMRLCGAEITSVEIGLLGAKISFRGEHTSYSDDFAIASGGILFNFIFSAASCILFMFVKNEMVLLLIFANIALAVVNLLPISFLDGGCMLRAFVSARYEITVAERCCRAFDLLGRTLLVCINILLLILSGFNIGLCVLLIVQLMGMVSG